MTSTMEANIAALTAPFEHVGISVDSPLVTPTEVHPPRGELEVDATALPMNLGPEAAQEFLRTLTVYQSRGEVQTHWGKGFYSSLASEATFLVEQVEGRPGERVTFAMGSRPLTKSDDPEDMESLQMITDSYDVPLSDLTDVSFGAGFFYTVGDDLEISQVAKLTPNGTSLGLGIYLLHCKTKMLRTMAEASGSDTLERIATRYEQGRPGELLGDGILRGATPAMFEGNITEAGITYVGKFNSEGYVKPMSHTARAIIGGVAAIVPNLMTTVTTKLLPRF